jgi:hypothetical protein
MIRLAVTDLESWRYWRMNEDAPLEDLIARLSHISPPTPEMQAGGAFAKLLEHAAAGEMDGGFVDGWRFVFALEEEFALPVAREVKAEEVFQTPSGPVTLVGQADGFSGMVVRDQKLTERFDAERYLDSLQWRAYLTMFGAQKFVYDIFQARYNENVVTVYGYEQLPFYAYPGMRADVQRAVEEVAEIVARYDVKRAA